MLIGYRLRQKITNRLIDGVMVLFLIATLFPIFWMVYCSFKGNNEILTGRVAPIKADNEVLFLGFDADRLINGSADGGVSLFDLKSEKLIKYFSARSTASSFFEDENYLWLASSTKGFLRINKKNLAAKKFSLPWSHLDISKISDTFLAGSADKIWLALGAENFHEIAEFDKAALKFTRIIEITEPADFQIQSLAYTSGMLWIGTNNGLIQYDVKKCATLNYCTFSQFLISESIKKIFPYENYLWLATTTGLYQFNPQNLKIEKIYSSGNGLVSDFVTGINGKAKNLYVGTNNGLSIINLTTKKITNFEKLFTKIVPETNTIGGLENLESAAVSSLTVKNGAIYLGSTFGRVSQFNLKSQKVAKLFFQKKGFIVIAWRNYIDLWKNIDFGKYLKNSLIICGGTMLFAMIFATLAAYALSRFNFPGNRSFGIAILATQMIPAIMYLIPLYIMFVKFNEITGLAIKGSFGGLIFIYTAFFTPFSIWILRGFFASIPVELEEAARIDGCSNFGVFWRIALPLALPGIIATGIYIFLTAWDELMFAWVLTSAKTMTIPVGIRLFVGNYQNRFDLMMAAATIATIPVMILFFMLQRYIIKGLTAGAVKG